jgi:Cu+-exporting ATPase
LGSDAALLLTAGASLHLTGFEGQHQVDGIPTLVAALLGGRALEARAKGETLVAQASLAALLPASSVLLRDGETLMIPTRDLLPGDEVRVGPGEAHPCDGTVVRGSSDTEEAALTGEPRPVPKTIGDRVIGGTRNGLGELVVRVGAVGDATTLAAILHAAETAQAHRGRLENLAERAIRPFVPAMIGVALATAVVWATLAGPASALLHGANVLLVACPCALGLAIPAALTVALGRASTLGVLVRRGSVLESAAVVTDACFDKTGTLTTGAMTLTAALPAPGVAEASLREAAAIAEAGIDHPIAKALQNDRVAASDWSRRVVPGEGVIASRGDEVIAAGTAAFVAQYLQCTLHEPAVAGGSSIAVARAGTMLGFVVVGDTLRPGSRPLVEALRAQHIAVTVLTGDDAGYAAAVLAPLHATIRARMTPDGKLAVLDDIRREKPGAVVLFVGDGINDAPALAAADVSIAMASGTAIARSAGDALLLHDDVRAIVPFLALARATVATMRRNLAWAVIYNVLALPVAAGAFERVGLMMTPTIAGACMAASSLGVLLQSLSLRFVKLDVA